MARMIPLYSMSSKADIERRAKELFDAAGRPEQRDLDFWLQAEKDHLNLAATEFTWQAQIRNRIS